MCVLSKYGFTKNFYNKQLEECSNAYVAHILHTITHTYIYRGYFFFQVVVPLNSLLAANPSSNPKNAAEKYIEILTVDNHEFWFMGFVNYEKAAKNLQEAPAYAN